MENYDEPNFLPRAEQVFNSGRTDSTEALTSRWAESKPGVFGIVVPGGTYIFESKNPEGELDVPVLHKSLIGGVLGITEDQVREGKHLRYMRGVDSAIQEVRSGTAQIACLLKPTSVEQAAAISFSGGAKPKKSTDFSPKPLLGVKIFKLHD